MPLADKFIILPVDKYNRLKMQSEKTDSPSTQQPAQMLIPDGRTETPSLLQSSKEPVIHPNDNEIPQDMPRQRETAPLSEAIILSTLPKMYRSKSSALLKYLGDELKWNQTGELVINGEDIKGTHIADLLRDIQHQFKNFHPMGRNRFWNMVQKANVPKYLIGNKHFFKESAPLPSVRKHKRVMQISKKPLSFKWEKL
jgi:hypothetical protein